MCAQALDAKITTIAPWRDAEFLERFKVGTCAICPVSLVDTCGGGGGGGGGNSIPAASILQLMLYSRSVRCFWCFSC